VWKNNVMQRARLSEAGFDMYDKVMRYNWEKLVEVMEKGKDFLLNHEAAMLVNGVMPATFKADYDAMANSIIGDVTFYLNEHQNILQVTQSKIMANNAIHVKGMEICKVGQQIFKRNPAKKTQFTWTSIMDIVTPPGAAGLRGTVKVSGSNLPIVGALIEMQTVGGVPLSFATDADGNFYSGNLPVGVYSFKLTKDDFATIETVVEIKTGTTSYKHLMMSAGGGTVYEAEGTLGAGMLANVAVEGLDNDDATVELEALGGTMNYFASFMAGGGNAMGGVITVNSNMPVAMKVNVLRANLGMNGMNKYLNVREMSGMGGSWKVRVSW